MGLEDATEAVKEGQEVKGSRFVWHSMQNAKIQPWIVSAGVIVRNGFSSSSTNWSWKGPRHKFHSQGCARFAGLTVRARLVVPTPRSRMARPHLHRRERALHDRPADQGFSCQFEIFEQDVTEWSDEEPLVIERDWFVTSCSCLCRFCCLS